MNIVIAPDKFKGSLSAREVCEAIRAGLKTLDSSYSIQAVPMADGGEGTAALLTAYSRGKMISCQVHDPLFRPIQSSYGISKDGTTAFIEMALASGLALLQPEERNPLHTSTLGTGDLIHDALDRGAKKIILGVGGSATNDAGMGAADALGMEFYTSSGERLKPIGENLVKIAFLRNDKIHYRLREIELTILCDVSNPLDGPHGAAQIFARQKGADDAMVEVLDKGLRNFKSVVAKNLNRMVDFPGAGAAGGLPAGLMALTDVTIKSGIEFLIAFTGLEALIRQADVVITGEGKIDRQTLSGKVVKGVADLAKKHRKPIIAFAGHSTLNEEETKVLGLRNIITLTGPDVPAQEAIKSAFSVLQMRTESTLPSILSVL